MTNLPDASSQPERIRYQNILRDVELIIVDVDGTMTDGGMYYSTDGEIMKRFSVHDGMGITLARRAGIEVAIMTSEVTEIVKKRAEKLSIRHCMLGSRAKKSDTADLAEKIGTVLEKVVFIGDDVNDALAMQSVGFSACPSDAVPYIKSLASYVCEAKGGHGVVREVVELILRSKGHTNSLPEHW